MTSFFLTSQALVGRNRSRYLVYALLQLAAVPLMLSGCSRSEQTPATVAEAPAEVQTPTPATVSADAPPAVLVRMGESAEELFDSALASRWQTATQQLQALNDDATQLPSDLPKADLIGQLRANIEALQGSTAAHNRVEAMDSANKVTRIVADLSADFQTDVPIGVVMLDYYGRQLELGIAKGDQATLAQATADLRQQWDRLQPTILQRGGVDEAKQFNDIVVQLEGARLPADFAAPTRAELDAVDRLESIFNPTN